MIVKSILDTDLYKFTTSYAYMKLFPQARGTFEFFDRDSAMTNASSEDIAFIRSKSKWDSGTAENILRRHTMKYLNPSFYGQQ